MIIEILSLIFSIVFIVGSVWFAVYSIKNYFKGIKFKKWIRSLPQAQLKSYEEQVEDFSLLEMLRGLVK